jgi:two-component system cell cycle response regulator
MLDVDQLKVINDRFGHDSGDVVLSEVARLLSRLVRDCDLPARTGGDEFAVILPDTAGESAKFIALRLRGGLRCDVAIPGLGELTVAVSIGTASSGGGDLLDANELRRSADEALYGQKKQRANILPRIHADPSKRRRSGRL